jgi:MFS family permease
MINPKDRPCEELLAHSVKGRPACTKRQQPWVLTATVLGSTMAFVDESVVNVALPAMEKDLGASLAAMQWVVNAYTLCLAALLLSGGAAGDQFGGARSSLSESPSSQLHRLDAGLRRVSCCSLPPAPPRV